MLSFFIWRLVHPVRNQLRKSILHYALKQGFDRDPDLYEVICFLRRNPLHHFPYPFVFKYRPSISSVYYDSNLSLHFVKHLGHRLYWRLGRKPKRIAVDYAFLVAEQDEDSPHRYLEPDFDVLSGEIVADVGCADGSFALEVVERAGHVYLFEADERWIKALEATFAPWRHKVTICHSLVGESNGLGIVSLDHYFADKQTPNFIKMDVEGNECGAVNGARGILKSSPRVRGVFCAYHRQDDETDLKKELKLLDFRVKPSRGYMLPYREANFGPPYFRRGLLRAWKE